MPQQTSLPDDLKHSLTAQMRSDPRVLAWANQHRTGGRGFVTVPASVLRQLGYNVADNWVLGVGSSRGPDQYELSDGIPSWMERAVNVGAGAITGYGASTILDDIINGAGAAGDAGYVNDTAPNISTPEGMANATALGQTNPVNAGMLPSLGGTAPVRFPRSGAGVENLINDQRDGGGLLDSILTGIKDYGPIALGGLGALQGLSQGPTEAEGDLSRILKLAESRITATEPLFNSLNRMVSAQLPAYARGEG